MADTAMPAGTPAITITITSTIETTATVPATSLSAGRPARQFVVGTTAPGAPCEVHAWCVETGQHIDHMGRRLAMNTRHGAELLTVFLYSDQPAGLPELCFDPGMDDWREDTTGAPLRAYTAQVRTHLARLDAFADEYDAMREAAGEAVDQAPVARRWTITTDAGVTVDGYLPAWSEEDPSWADVPANRLQMVLSNLTFTRGYPGQVMTVDTPSGMDDPREVGEMEVFRAQIWCAPHDADHPDQREPYGIVTVLPDCVMEHLSPDDLTTVAAKLRDQADRIDQAAVDLVAARADWAKNGGTR